MLRRDAWRLSPEAVPDVYEAELVQGRPHKVTFITDVDSISFLVKEGKQYDFIIRFGDRNCHTRIVGTRFTPAAQFDEAYRSTHQGKTFVEVPEVYELVNVVIAMTPTGIADRELVYHDSEYYKRMRAWFDKHRDQPLLAALDAELAANPSQYFTLKMNGYAFEFDEHDKLVSSKVYDRTGFSGESRNALRPYLEKLQAFSDATGFRRFFRENAATYQDQIAFFRDIADVGEMKRWLDRNFPTSSDYDCYKIVFSPLVAYNQSATWLESNGFKELQAHVNYPYPQALTRYTQASPFAARRGSLPRQHRLHRAQSRLHQSRSRQVRRPHPEGGERQGSLGRQEQRAGLLPLHRFVQRIYELGLGEPASRRLRPSRRARGDDCRASTA